MKNQTNIAYLYICHNNPELLGRVANALEYNKDTIFVHVDNKVDITPFIEATKNQKNVYFINERVENYWGGFNSVIATVDLMRMALNQGEYSRFVLLQGQDYPLFRQKKFMLFLTTTISSTVELRTLPFLMTKKII